MAGPLHVRISGPKHAPQFPHFGVHLSVNLRCSPDLTRPYPPLYAHLSIFLTGPPTSFQPLAARLSHLNFRDSIRCSLHPSPLTGNSLGFSSAQTVSTVFGPSLTFVAELSPPALLSIHRTPDADSPIQSNVLPPDLCALSSSL
ncbi:hypothetical protein HYQ44_009889 [Verticillium longisporum]|nr:hypothetical protein HYQ44_009889 [Verticillium longisporum]